MRSIVENCDPTSLPPLTLNISSLKDKITIQLSDNGEISLKIIFLTFLSPR